MLEKGIIFCSISEAIQEHPGWLKNIWEQLFLLEIISFLDFKFSFFQTDLSVTYLKEFNVQWNFLHILGLMAGTGQFERTLLIADEGSQVSYLEGCTAPMRDENQLHAAVVELIALDNADIKYSTVQNWYPGDKDGNGGVFNFVTKRGICHKNAKISWTQVETGSAVTWKYPSCILKGDNSIGEFFSVALTNNKQQADTGTKMVHLGKNTKSTIIAKGISAGYSDGNYRGLVRIAKGATNSRNFSQCDSLLMGDKCGSHTFPYIEVKNNSSQVEHEATTSKIGEDQIFYCNQKRNWNRRSDCFNC